MKIDPVRTARLTLRCYTPDDLPFVTSVWNDPEMGRYLCDPDRDHMDEKYVKSMQNLADDETCCYLIAQDAETGERIGTCSFIPDAAFHTVDLGYCIHKKFWRQGYATEMVSGLLKELVSRGAHAFTVSVAKENPGSNALMRKLGFHVEKEGSFRKRNTDIVYAEYIYRLDR